MFEDIPMYLPRLLLMAVLCASPILHPAAAQEGDEGKGTRRPAAAQPKDGGKAASGKAKDAERKKGDRGVTPKAGECTVPDWCGKCDCSLPKLFDW